MPSGKINQAAVNLVLGVLNILYVGATLVLTCPPLYYDSAAETYLPTLGFSLSVYALSYFYSFMQKNFQAEELPSGGWRRLFEVIGLLGVIVCVILVIVYYAFHCPDEVLWTAYYFGCAPGLGIISDFLTAGKDFVLNRQKI